MFDGLFQPTHLLLILLICLVIFGPSKLPQLGKGLGESIREFKRAITSSNEPQASSTTSSAAAVHQEEKK
ncbi:MAG TPA: twin-arginine translocase TatA/TatE family subunit [Terriglobales bacterium]|nr:twin-arginine translocase TatA/TatE family subunit [Terriglobales bacterium]